MWPRSEGFSKASFCTPHKQFEKQQKPPKKIPIKRNVVRKKICHMEEKNKK
jgi:hypothetical protein